MPATFREGRAPSGAHEMALDARTAKKAGYELGDSVDVVFEDGRRTFTLVGDHRLRGDRQPAGRHARRIRPAHRPARARQGRVWSTRSTSRREDGVDAGELRDRIAEVLPDGVEALTGEQAAAAARRLGQDALGIFTTVLLVFAGVALLVGSFVIWNTFNVLVAQRRREVALLRAVGATRRQVLGGVLLEAGLIGLVSGLVGLLPVSGWPSASARC